jgi:AcrR family transcriptional regulator
MTLVSYQAHLGIQCSDMTRSPERARAHALHSRKQDLVRGAIWDAAVDLFAATGFEETTIDDIARVAGVSTRTFFRYFASKNDLMGQGMVTYRTLLSDAIRKAPQPSSPLQVVRHTVQQVASEAATHPRTRKIVQITSTSVAAREAQLSRRADVENAVAQAFALRCRTAPSDEVTPRLLTGLTLSILDVTFRKWSKRADTDIVAITDEVFATLTALVSDRQPTRKKRPTPSP